MNPSLEFKHRIRRVFGRRGESWLAELSAIIDHCRQKWGLTDCSVGPNLSLSYIEFAKTPGGEPVVLKVGVPHPELFTEMAALGLYAETQRRSVRLIAADADLGAMLMDEVSPGRTLDTVGDNREETAVLASLVQSLPVRPPASHGFPHIRDQVERALRLTRSEWDPEECLPRDLLCSAQVALDTILQEGGEALLLHGDLHHENILLDDSRGWLAIDPKGVIGPRCYEVGRFMQNPLPLPDRVSERTEAVTERVGVLSEMLGMPIRLLHASAFVDCVLSTCWCFEEQAKPDGWERTVRLARWLESWG